jgi:hypothetical protein
LDEERVVRDLKSASRPRLLQLVSVVIGVIAVSGALLAILRRSDGPEPAISWKHTWAAEVSGNVWITVDADDAETRRIDLHWGPFDRSILHTSADPTTYVFSKNLTPEGQEPVSITVDVTPGAVVVFGEGEPPTPFEDVNADWVRREGSDNQEDQGDGSDTTGGTT